MTQNTIQWFPGHMHKARKEIEEQLPKVDLILEVLDARIPFSSSNPLVENFSKDKLCLKLLNKADLADPIATKRWVDHFNQQENTHALAVSTIEKQSILDLLPLCLDIAKHRLDVSKQVRMMIMGIPNVGKSTIINLLAGKTIAQTGNQPAVTRRQQRIHLAHNIVLSDTPGILWPKVENPHSSFRLGATGAIKDTAMEYEEVAFYTIEYLISAYKDHLLKRYEIEEDVFEGSPIEVLEAIGLKRGCLRSKGSVDFYKASTLLLNELRSAKLGRITLELPEMIPEELEQAEKAAQEKAEMKAQKKIDRRKRYLKNKR